MTTIAYPITDQQYEYEYKKVLGVSYQLPGYPPSQENLSSLPFIFNSQIMTNNVPIPAPNLTDDPPTTVTNGGNKYSTQNPNIFYYEYLKLTYSKNSANYAYFYDPDQNNNLTTQSIPSTYDPNGSYTIKVYHSSDGNTFTQIASDTGDMTWIFDNATGTLTFTKQKWTNVYNDGTYPYISFYRYEGPFGISGSTGSSQWINTTSGNTGIYYNSGNVGIGTTTPDYTLDVSGNLNVNDILHVNNISSSNDYINIYDTTSNTNSPNYWYFNKYGDFGYYLPTGSSEWLIQSNGNATFTGTVTANLLSVLGNSTISGNLGIGTNPTYPLDVSGNSRTIGNVGIGMVPDSSTYQLSVSTNSKFGSISNTQGYCTIMSGYTSSGNKYTGYMEFKAASDTRLGYIGNISNDGNTANGPLLISLNNGTTGLQIISDIGINGTVVSTFTNTGKVGIGKSPGSSYALDVSGNASATTFTTTSDYRIKENIKHIDENYTVDLLSPKTYFNKNLNRQDIGLIAHELSEHYPYLVFGEKDGENLQSINYTGIIGILIKEIKDLKKELVSVKDEINKLKQLNKNET